MRRLDWINTLTIAFVHVMAVVALVYMARVHFSWATLGLAVAWYFVTGMSVTGGYHRLFAHRAYKAHPVTRALYLVFGAGALENSALTWAGDHRVHHSETDRESDPYSVRHGFWWAHLGWVLARREASHPQELVADLAADPLVRWQHRYYVLLAIVSGLLIPAALGSLWGDALGALLACGFLRQVALWHATFSINSFAHLVGTRPYCKQSTARDNPVLALFSYGEGYHNFHHRFQADYRNGHRWFHFDPTKWMIWTLARVRLAWDLKKVPADVIRTARERALNAVLHSRGTKHESMAA